MTAAGHSDKQSAAGRHGSSRRAGSRRSSDSGDGLESGYSAEVASQLAEASVQLGARLADPGVPHGVDEIARVTREFSTSVEGMADGLGGVTEWLRAAGHAGALSGYASVVADRLAHAGKELARLAEAINEAERRAS